MLGNAVHATLAAYLRTESAKRAEAHAHQLLRHHWSLTPRDVAFIHEEEEAAWGRQALEVMSRFCEGADAKAHPFAIEEWVRARLPNGRRVCGRVDRADRTKEGLEIVDYKTGARPQDFDIGRELAARLYALAAFRTFNQPIASVRFAWLAEESNDVWSPEREDLAAIEDELAELTECVSCDRTMSAVPGGWCRHCPFRDQCPARPEEASLEVADLPF